LLLPRRVEEVLIAVSGHRYDDLVRRLAEEGILHVDKPPRELGGVDRRFQLALMRASEKLSRLEGYFDLMGVKPSTLKGVEVRIPGWLEAVEALAEEYRDSEEAAQRAEAEISRLEERLAALQQARAILEAFKSIDADLARASEVSAVAFAAGLTGPEGLEALRSEAERLGLLVAWEEAGEGAYVVALAGRHAAVREAVSKLGAAGWTPFRVPEGLPGNPAKAYEALREEVSRIIREVEEIRERLRREHMERLLEYYTKLRVVEAALKVLANTASRGGFRFIRGFVDTKDSRRLRRIIGEVTGGAHVVYSLGIRRVAEEEKAPTRVELPKPIRPFHKIIRLYGEPKPNEVVPTVFAAITMPIIFGLMFPDLGHALLVITFAYLFFRKRDPEWAYIVTVLGLAGAVTGILAGEFFGPLTGEPLVAMWHKLGFEHPPLASPVDLSAEAPEAGRAMMFRYISISLFIGAFMLSLGTLLGIVNAILAREYLEAAAVKVPKFLIFGFGTLPFLLHPLDVNAASSTIKHAVFGPRTGLASLVFYTVAIGFLWIIVGPAVAAKLEGHSPAGGLAKGFLEMYESTLMILGNTPSFLRIMGLSLAHSSLMFGFTEMTIPLLHGLAYIGGAIVYIIGNLLTAGLEGILVFAHSLRLHFYEWFTKFYHGGGVPFQPVTLPAGARIILAPTH
jgi:V/A-type H+-transporting ATPase subunit I